jgi:hypothetical protein
MGLFRSHLKDWRVLEIFVEKHSSTVLGARMVTLFSSYIIEGP